MKASGRLAGLAEVAELCGVSKRAAWNYTRRDGFPKPIDELRSGPVWRRTDIERWATKNLPLARGRPKRP
jgi:chromosome partitioning protein